jgi:uncharacterized membrane protein
MRLDRVLVASVLTLLAASTPLAAQDTVRLARATRVRIVTRWTQVPERWTVGSIQRATYDSLVLGVCASCTPVAQAWSDVLRLQVSRGRTAATHSVVGGAVLGAVAAVGYVAYDVTHTRCQGDGPCMAGAQFAFPIYILGGAFLGGALGTFIHREERWQAVAVPAPPPR